VLFVRVGGATSDALIATPVASSAAVDDVDERAAIGRHIAASVPAGSMVSVFARCCPMDRLTD
jgi:hypothetical protein